VSRPIEAVAADLKAAEAKYQAAQRAVDTANWVARKACEAAWETAWDRVVALRAELAAAQAVRS